ncbi:MAG: HEPN domain-containing protein [Desulfobacterales bacterium]|nr:HEPN domain-containing protein [Desulfobacterales bacterium]
MDASANRAYYAAFQAAAAALAARGVTREKLGHDWIQGDFSGKLIKRQKIYPGKLKSYLTDMQAVRDQADYKVANVSKKEASQQLRKSKEMITFIEKELA